MMILKLNKNINSNPEIFGQSISMNRLNGGSGSSLYGDLEKLRNGAGARLEAALQTSSVITKESKPVICQFLNFKLQ